MVFLVFAALGLLIAYLLPVIVRFKQQYDLIKLIPGPSIFELMEATRKRSINMDMFL